MAEEEKPKQLVQMSTVFASGIAAIIAALFTSRLGVAGTLIGTALTPMLMTVGVAVLNAQIEKATEKISDLPTTVRGRLSTQRVRVPGTPSPEDPPEAQEDPPAPTRRRDRRTPGIWERILSIPTFLKNLSPSARRRTLLTGVAAGLVAAVIGLAGVTGIEAASGNTLSCGLYERCADGGSDGGTAEAGTSLTRVLGGSGGTDTEAPATGDEEQAPEVQQQEEAQPAAPDGGAAPAESEQYEAVPQDGVGQETPPEESQEALPQEDPVQQQPAAGEEPEALPQDGSQPQPADPGAEQQQATPPEQQQQ